MDSAAEVKGPRFHSRYLTAELQRVFAEDTESDSDVFEGFTQSEVDMQNKMVLTESDEDSDVVVLSDSEEAPSPPKRRSFGLRVALQFPNKKCVNKTKKKSNTPLVKPGRQEEEEEKAPALGKNLQRGTKRKVTPTSHSETANGKTNKESSSALLKRAMNIKENKAVLAQLLAELNSMPELFPMKTTPATPSKAKKTPRRTFSEGQMERRTNPTRNARPPENFALENFTLSAVKFAEHLQNCRKGTFLKRTLSEEEREEYRRKRRSSKYTTVRSVEDITEEELDNVAITVKDKIYDKIMGSTCHQCRQKTIDTKTVCRNLGCGGVRGQFCGPCLRNRYGEDVRTALLDPDWICPPCRLICNCSYCRKRDGRCATGMLIHLAKFYGHDNVKEYLESLQKNIMEDD
ncbi:cell division cycle-associated 7-like protein [Spea bombifrons]|uniref:cell division cycle-associated 7-like protein n=1 Tax=Spea bombifrons TaxID=233779 RepID=UPI002349F123|nr:cell division cycle-associated 7-like protein [Spea bombifrons]